MAKRRIILGAFIVGTGVFASFFGGAARTLFYIALLIPIFSLIYTFYVYLRFRIYQTAESKIIVKGEKVPYYFALSDEDFISYADVRVEFLKDFSTPQNMELSRSYHLSPNEKIEKRTEILCRYRGEYPIGVKSVIVTDFLGIMRIKYPAASTINMCVLPKITEVERITLSPLDSDAKLLRFSRGSGSEPPDCETRKYIKGDSVKLINHKLSAKKRELFVRQISDVQNDSVVFIMDMTAITSGEYERVITEDKIIESALTVADYLVRKSVAISVIYEQGGVRRDFIENPASLKAFYGKCAAMKFRSPYTPAKICGALPQLTSGGGFVIFAVSSLTKELCETAESIIRLGGDAAILLIGENGRELSEALDKGVIFKTIALTDEVSSVLGGGDEH